jgi:HlyD family secretion protein
VRAERAGLVVHRELFFGQERRRPQVGDEAWPNQPLLVIPDSNDLIVESRIRETDLRRVGVGAVARITVDAWPDLPLGGRVTSLGAIGVSDASSPGVRLFPVTIALRGTDERLRTGMTVRIDVEVASVPDAVLVPVSAVFDQDTSPYCLVETRWRTERRAVSIAARGDVMVALTGGVAAGERVVVSNAAADGGRR